MSLLQESVRGIKAMMGDVEAIHDIQNPRNEENRTILGKTTRLSRAIDPAIPFDGANYIYDTQYGGITKGTIFVSTPDATSFFQTYFYALDSGGASIKYSFGAVDCQSVDRIVRIQQILASSYKFDLLITPSQYASKYLARQRRELEQTYGRCVLIGDPKPLSDA